MHYLILNNTKEFITIGQISHLVLVILCKAHKEDVIPSETLEHFKVFLIWAAGISAKCSG